MRTAVLALFLPLFLVTASSGDEFVMPRGDSVRGQEAFVALRCHACHRVQGARLPAPVATPAVPITLGAAPSTWTDAWLVTSIIAPSHAITRAEYGESVATGGMSRMGDFTSVMTVRQLIDIVSYLRQHERK